MFDSDQLSVIKWCWWSLPVWTLIRTSVMFRSVRSPRWSSTLWSTWFWLPRLYFCGNQWNSKKGWTHGGQRQQGGSMFCRDELGLQHKPEQRHYQLEQPLKLTTIQPIRLQDVQRNVCVCELTPATLLLRRSPPWHAGRWTNRTTVRMTWAARSTHSTRSHRTRPGSHTHTHTSSQPISAQTPAETLRVGCFWPSSVRIGQRCILPTLHKPWSPEKPSEDTERSVAALSYSHHVNELTRLWCNETRSCSADCERDRSVRPVQSCWPYKVKPC